jgi:hypothetical protein
MNLFDYVCELELLRLVYLVNKSREVLKSIMVWLVLDEALHLQQIIVPKDY